MPSPCAKMAPDMESGDDEEGEDRAGTWQLRQVMLRASELGKKCWRGGRKGEGGERRKS